MIWQIVALIFSAGFLSGFLIGAFIEWNRYDKTSREYRRELRSAYKEQDDLRGIIYTQSLNLQPSKGK